MILAIQAADSLAAAACGPRGGLRPRLVEEDAPGAVLQQQQLEQPGVAFEERRFARSQIQVPHADEAVVEPEGAHAREALAKPGAPRAQGVRVVGAAILGVIQRERRGPRRATSASRRPTRARRREDVPLDPVRRAVVLGEPLIVDRDRLQEHHAIRREQAVDGREVVVVVR